MARKNHIGISFSGFEELAAKLDELTDDIKPAVEEALKAGHKNATEKLRKSIQKDKLPAKGKYSTGATEKALKTDDKVEWNGTTATIKVGFNLDVSMQSIYLMYGTPKMKPVAGMKAAIYGKASIKEREELQKEIFDKAIKKAMEG